MWVQMFNFPLGMMNKSYGEFLGVAIGEVLDVDVNKMDQDGDLSLELESGLTS